MKREEDYGTNTEKFKAGDYVFYKHKDGGMIPTKVWAVTAKRVLVENWNKSYDFTQPKAVAVYVKSEKLILQSEWEKENQ